MKMLPCNVLHRLIARNNRIYILASYMNRYPCVGIHTSRYLSEEGRKRKRRKDDLDFNKVFSNEDDDSTVSRENVKLSEKDLGKSYRPDNYSTYQSFVRGNTEAWEYQPYVVLFCMTVFFIYLFYFKQETYLDEVLETPLHERIPGLEEATLIAKINEAKRRGLDSTAEQKRLNELRAARARPS